ncbi:hypothetical protein COB18_00330 [Candidatus Kaiserbacteria bacterium]|nr:MAG: hypothetical protein COB18_00330 [Candidatus Kaiserbacteria bacterium]
MSEYKLTQGILALSDAEKWDIAKLEWVLDYIYEEHDSVCLCGRYPITEVCTLKNTRNGNETNVGNCCVQKFTGLSSNKLFQALKRIKKDIHRSVNAEVVSMAYEKKYLTEWERDFYLDTFRRTKMTEKQLTRRRIINEKILKGFSQ